MNEIHASNETHSTVITEKVLKGADYIAFLLLTGLSLTSILYFMWHWFSHEHWLYYPVTFLILTSILITKISINQFRWFLLLYMKRPKLMTPKLGRKVGVATTFVPSAEPLEMLEETVGALMSLDYPHETWVLDEGDDDRVKALCLKLGANHFSRKNLPHYQTDHGIFQSRTKHGNYNAWLYEIGFDQYEIITAFDPDHIPDPTFLSKVLGYFDDPKIGYVQVAQAYYNQSASFIARGAAEETYAYYSATQMASYAMGFPIVTGCHNTHRVTALKHVNGFAPHDGDDLLITLFYRACGWQGVYVPQILAKGLTPVDWNGYLIQQLRWARSVLDIKFRIYPKLAGRLPLRERVLSFLHGFYYLQGIATFIGIMLMVFMLATGTIPRALSYLTLSKLIVLYAVLQLCDLYRQKFYLDWRNEAGLHWRAGVLQLAKWPYLLLAVYDVILGRRFPYSITHKKKMTALRRNLLWPHVIAIILLCTAWVIGLTSGRVIPSILEWWTVVTVAGLLALISTEFISFPSPYDKSLSPLADEVNQFSQSGPQAKVQTLARESSTEADIMQRVAKEK